MLECTPVSETVHRVFNHPDANLTPDDLYQLRVWLENHSKQVELDLFEVPQRIIFFDGVKEENSCEKLVGPDQCQKLLSQTVNEYEFFRYSGGAKKLENNAIRRFPSSILE